jgi:hypothetical protein
VAGDVAAGGFAGAWVALDGHAQPMDVTDFEGIRLRIRGDGALRLGLRAGPLPGIVELYTSRADAQLRVQGAPAFAVRFESSPMRRSRPS